MVNSKKMNKSTVAVVVLALLLVLSLILSATGAWFTDKEENDAASNLTFGYIDIELDAENGYKLEGGSAEMTGYDVMPGDTLTVSYTVNNKGEAAYVRSTITVTFNVDNFGDANKEALDTAMTDAGWETATPKTGIYTYTVKNGSDAVIALAKETGSKEVTASIVLPTTLTNAAAEQTITVGYIVEAVQQANNSEKTFPGTIEEYTHA